MFKDMNGNHITLHTVVVNSRGDVYSVESIEPSREFMLKLRNGCCVSYDKAENLKVLTRIN